MKKEELKRLLRLATESNEQKDLEIQKMRDIIVKKKIKIPFLTETKHELFEAEKEVVGGATNFSEIPIWDANVSYVCGTAVMFGGKKLYAFKDGVEPSRFMPNVKFVSPVEFISFSHILDINEEWSYYKTSPDGEKLIGGNLNIHNAINLKEVHYLEAIPELVPDGMVYDKESDSLVRGRILTAEQMADIMSVKTSFSSQVNIDSSVFAKVWKKLNSGKNHTADYLAFKMKDGLGFVPVDEDAPLRRKGEWLCMNKMHKGEFCDCEQFTVTEVFSKCHSCAKKSSCNFLELLGGFRFITECDKFEVE